MTPSPFPEFVGVGSISKSTTTVSPGLPTDAQPGDFLFLFVETAGQDFQMPDNAASDWREVGMVDNTGTRCQCYWKRMEVGEVASTFPDSGDHANAVIVAWRNCDPIQPWDVLTTQSTGSAGGANPTLTIQGGTTTVDNCSIMMFVVDDIDSAAERFQEYANADLVGIGEIVDSGTSDSGGGGFAVMRARKASAGAFGDTTVRDMTTNPIWAGRHIVLRPPQPEPDQDDYPYIADFAGTSSATATTHAIRLPKRRRPGDLMIFDVATDGNTAIGAGARPPGWEFFGLERSGGSSSHAEGFWRICDGTEADTATLTLGGADQIAASCFAIRNWGGVCATSGVTTLGSADNPAIVPFGWGDTEKTLWIITCGGPGQGTPDDNDWPTNFTKYRHNVRELSGGVGMAVAASEQQVASVDPAAWGAGFPGSQHYRYLTIAVRSRQQKDTPYMPVAAGAYSSSAGGAVTVDFGSYGGKEDIAVAVIEAGVGSTMTPPAGWTEFDGFPIESTNVQITLWWRRLVEGEGLLTLSVPTVGRVNHASARGLLLRGVIRTGDPSHVILTSIENTSDTSVSILGPTTTADGCVVLKVVGTTRDASGDNVEFSGWANDQCVNVDEIMDNTTLQGTGGGFGAAIMERPNEGWTGYTLATAATATDKPMAAIAFAAAPRYYEGEDDLYVADIAVVS